MKDDNKVESIAVKMLMSAKQVIISNFCNQ